MEAEAASFNTEMDSILLGSISLAEFPKSNPSLPFEASFLFKLVIYSSTFTW
jgi:hypothetical protein